MALRDPERLGRGSRAASRARHDAWKTFKENLRQLWLIVAGVCALGVVAPIPLLLWRWTAFTLVAAGTVAGFAIAAAFWIVLTVSGASNLLMGIVAEEWTIQDLQRLRPRWNLANGFRLSHDDIDHILLNESAAWVFETKWIGQPWEGSWYSDFALRRALEQCQRNRKRFQGHFTRWIPPESIHAAVIVWSPPADPGAPEPWSDDGITVVPGVHLRRWLDSVVANSRGHLDLEGAWAEVRSHSIKREDYEASHGHARPSSFQAVLIRSIVAPSALFLAAAYVPLALAASRIAPLPGSLAALEVGVAVASFTRIRRSWRASVAAWALGATAALIIACVVYVSAA